MDVIEFEDCTMNGCKLLELHVIGLLLLTLIAYAGKYLHPGIVLNYDQTTPKCSRSVTVT